MRKNDLKRQVSEVISACQEKRAEEITVLELEKAAGAFTDYFVVCSGTNPRQIQAIADEVEERLRKADLRPAHVEGYKKAECSARIFGKSAQVLRPGASVEIGQAAGTRRTCGWSWQAEARDGYAWQKEAGLDGSPCLTGCMRSAGVHCWQHL